MATREQELFFKLVRAERRASGLLADLLGEHGLSEPQYNALRILRGAGEAGLPCREVGERLHTRHSDVTRLVDRMAEAGLVSRERGAGPDRRVVTNRITPAGLELVAKLDGPVRRVHARQFAGLGRDEMRRLGELLDKAGA